MKEAGHVQTEENDKWGRTPMGKIQERFVEQMKKEHFVEQMQEHFVEQMQEHFV